MDAFMAMIYRETAGVLAFERCGVSRRSDDGGNLGVGTKRESLRHRRHPKTG
jgi:hypothetical protein